MLGELVPASAVAAPPTLGRRSLAIVAQVVAVGIGTVLLLLRIPGLPSWDTIYGEDYWEFLVQALQQPWHVFIAYNGYEQLVPRVLAQFALYLPLAQASRLFAVCGALIAVGCGLFVFHASAGHIRSVPLRALLGAAVVLLPSAPMEIADSSVNTPWYLLLALFWALLWRPRTRKGMAAAALVAFATVASNSLAILFVPLVAARLYVLRQPREHAVTAGWLAGCMVQLPFILSGLISGHSRLAGRPAPPGVSLAYYAHEVVLPSLGWHLAWWLQSLAGRNGATVIVAAVLAVILGAILVVQARNRPFVVTAVATGFVFPVFGTTLIAHIATTPVSPDYEAGARYTALPIFLIEAAVIVGVDYAMRRRAGGHHRPGIALRPALAVTALVAVLAASWVADFRYSGIRSEKAWNWGQIAAKWQRDCAHSRSGKIVEKVVVFQTLPCDRIGQ